MILSYADMNDQQKKYMKRIKRAYEDGKVSENIIIMKALKCKTLNA